MEKSVKKITVQLSELYMIGGIFRGLLKFPMSPLCAYNLKSIAQNIDVEFEKIESARQSLLKKEDLDKKQKEETFVRFLNENSCEISFIPFDKKLFLKEESVKISIEDLATIEKFME